MAATPHPTTRRLTREDESVFLEDAELSEIPERARHASNHREL